jgi:hypothetical protein
VGDKNAIGRAQRGGQRVEQGGVVVDDQDTLRLHGTNLVA